MEDDIQKMYKEVEQEQDNDKKLSANLTQLYLLHQGIEAKFGFIDFSLIGESFMHKMKTLRNSELKKMKRVGTNGGIKKTMPERLNHGVYCVTDDERIEVKSIGSKDNPLYEIAIVGTNMTHNFEVGYRETLSEILNFMKFNKKLSAWKNIVPPNTILNW